MSPRPTATGGADDTTGFSEGSAESDNGSGGTAPPAEPQLTDEEAAAAPDAGTDAGAARVDRSASEVEAGAPPE